MYLNILPPVLEEMLEYKNQDEITHLEITDVALLKEYFGEKMLQSLLERKRSLVVIPDSMDISVPTKILTTYQLGHYSAIYSNDDGPNIANRIKALTELREIPLIRQEYHNVQLKAKELKNRIQDTLHSINKGNIKSPSFKEMLLSIKPRPKANISASVVESISSVNLNPSISRKIAELQSMYRRRFFYMDACNAFTPACLEDDAALAFAQDELFNISTDINQITQNIERELYLKKRMISYDVEEEVGEWLQTKDELQDLFLKSQLDNSHLSFEQNALPLLQKFDGYQYLKLLLNVIPEKGWGQVTNIISVVQAIADNARNSIDIYFEQYVQKLSPYNTSNDVLDQYISDGYEILKTINNSKYINHQCGDTFLQVGALLIALKKAKHKTAQCSRCLLDDPYVKFKLAIKEISLDDTVVQSLYHLENQNWSEIISFYGQRSHLINNYTSNMNRLSAWSNELRQTHQLLRHTCHKELHNRWFTIRNRAESNIKNNNWETYRELMEVPECNYSFAQIASQIGDTLLDFFPITIVRESDLEEAVRHLDLNYSESFFLDSKEVDIRNIKILKEHNISINIASTYILNIDDISSKYDLLSNYCNHSRITDNAPLTSLDQSDRYRHAVSFAQSITSLARSINIYKLGAQILISTVDSLLDNRICQLLNISTVHILHRDTSDPAHIVESLIHHDDIILIIENHLLNDHTGMNTLWQKHMLDQLLQSGIKIYNFSTHDLYNDITGTMEKFGQSFMNKKKELYKEDLVLVS